MSQTRRKILVTMALPYANGPLHLGHLVEAIQADVWVRFQKMQENSCYFISGDDAHGTAIMLEAQKKGMTAEALIAQIKTDHQADLAKFLIDLNFYGSTHTPENQRFVEMIYRHLKEKQVIIDQVIAQYFDDTAQLFLPDRYIKGTCPRCHTPNQYGDNCEACGATYLATELLHPVSVLSDTKPVIKNTQHFFLDLAKFTQALTDFLENTPLQPAIKRKLQEWFDAGLVPWDITRDAPYFGFPVPEHPDKYFYVWLDAPIAYMAIFKQFCDQQDVEFAPFWQPDSHTELYHFIGKDIMYFHALFWPAILMGAHLKVPNNLFVHGFLTVNGQKMSKSRGTFISAKTYLQHINPEYLRYYFAAKSNNHIEDIDLNLEDFMLRINADLIGKVINIASRLTFFINKYFNHQLSQHCLLPELFQSFVTAGESIMAHYENRQYSQAVKEIMLLADKANQYIDEQKPWALMKEPGNEAFVQEICSMGLNLFLLLITYLKPILPNTAENTEKLFNISPLSFANRHGPLVNHHKINPFQPLLQRITPEQIMALQNEAKIKSENPENSEKLEKTEKPETIFPEISPVISYEDFAKIDLRIAKIIHAEHMEGAEKLLKLTVDIGLEKRQIFAGIKSAYEPEKLINQLTVVVANLAPRKMRFGLSEGMILAAGPGGKELWLLQPHEGAQAGMRVK